MYEHSATIENPSDHDLQIVIEPWGRIYALPAGSSFQVIARSAQGGELEVKSDPPWITVWMWAGATFTLFQDGILLDEA